MLCLCQVLASHIEVFVTMLSDEDLSVRRAALLTLNSIVHHQPQLVVSFLDSLVFPVLYETIQLKMKRVVDLGPFKHTVDDGLPLRKAAVSCMDTILDVMPERIHISAFLPYLVDGLKDNEQDVQMLCHQILSKICGFQPGVVLGSLESIIEPLDKAVNKKVKGAQDGQVGTEVERANDLIRSALRAVDAISQMPDIELSQKFQDFVSRIQKKEAVFLMLAGIRAEAR